MTLFTVLALIDPALDGDLAKGHFAEVARETSSHGLASILVAADQVAIDGSTGALRRRDGTGPASIFEALGFADLATMLTGRHTLALGIGDPGLISRAIVAAFPSSDPVVLDANTLSLADLDRAQVVRLLIEALVLVGRINARRDPQSLAADPNSGIARVFTSIRPIA